MKKQLVELSKVAAKSFVHRVKHGKSDIKLLPAIGQLLNYRLNWEKRSLSYMPDGDLPSKFMSAREAAKLIPDGATILSTGIAGNSRCSIYFWAIKDRFEKTGTPSGLTWMSVTAIGGRGKAPGTIEELALPGLITRHVTGHLETHKALLKMGQEGQMEIHTMPQGVIGHVIRELGKGATEYKSQIGLGTFLDPATGGGSNILSRNGASLIKSNGKALVYSLPEVDVAIFSAPYADKFGNIYFKKAATITENYDAVEAAKVNGGRVLVTVSDIIDHSPDEISIPADRVDAIVVNPRNEQTGGVLQRQFFPMFTEGAETDIVAAYNLVKFANTFTGITPIRDSVDNAIARLAASIFVQETKPESLVNIGVGLPEEVSRILFESGLYKRLTFSTESGVYGGLPVSGMYFGAAINPKKLMPSVEIFKMYATSLNTSVLGYLEVDSDGNVNVSRRSDSATDYVGPGGFPDIVSSAKTIIFVGKWSEGGSYAIKNGKLVIEKQGKPKFNQQVRETTFNAQNALAKGTKVYYVSTVGVFRLTPEGLELISVMPGVDIKKDILDFCRADIIIPKGGNVPVIEDDIVTGGGFSPRFSLGNSQGD